MQVYSALQRRNELALKTHLQTAETGDAAELIARLGPCGQFTSGYSSFAEMAAEVSSTKEAHHFYPVMFYFRFRNSYYAVSRFSLVSLDAAALIRTALDASLYGWLQESAAVEMMARGPLLLLETLGDRFHAVRQNPGAQPDDEEQERWRARFAAAVARLQQAGIRTVADERAGAARYLQLRAEWQTYITALAPVMAFDMKDVDVALFAAGRAD
jgi:hypothetical protein